MIIYNEGELAKLNIFEVLDLKPGYYAILGLKNLDREQLYQVGWAAQATVKLARQAGAVQNTVEDREIISAEMLYAAGDGP